MRNADPPSNSTIDPAHFRRLLADYGEEYAMQEARRYPEPKQAAELPRHFKPGTIYRCLGTRLRSELLLGDLLVLIPGSTRVTCASTREIVNRDTFQVTDSGQGDQFPGGHAITEVAANCSIDEIAAVLRAAPERRAGIAEAIALLHNAADRLNRLGVPLSFEIGGGR